MNLNWKLFKVFRRELWIYTGVEVLIVFLIAINDLRAGKPDSAVDSLGASAFLALLLCMVLRMSSRLNRMPFPVSVQQRAWLPVLAFLTLWFSGIAAILGAALFFGFSPAQWAAMLGHILIRIPLFVFGFLWVFRLVQFTPHLLGCAFVIMFLPESVNKQDNVFGVSWFFIALPASLIMISFYLIEIPKQLAGRDRLLIAQGLPQQGSWMRDINIEPRRTAMAWIGSILDAIIFLGLVLMLGFMITKSMDQYFLSVQTYMARPWLSWFPLVVVFLFYTLFKEGYGLATASGFGLYSSAWMSLARLTIILSPLAQALGMKKGIVTRCDQCRNAKFIWAHYCPHCSFPGPGTIQNKQMARLARGEPVRISMRQKIILRLFIPLQLVVMLGFFGTPGNRPFEGYTTLLIFQDAEVARKAASIIEAWVGTQVESSDWLNATNSPGQIPEKYRLQVVHYEGNKHLSIQAYGLRWDSARHLPEILVEHLEPSLKAAGEFTTTPMKTRVASSPFMQTRTYLDNHVHWVERDDPPPREIRNREMSTPVLEEPAKRLPALPPKRVE